MNEVQKEEAGEAVQYTSPSPPIDAEVPERHEHSSYEDLGVDEADADFEAEETNKKEQASDDLGTREQ